MDPLKLLMSFLNAVSEDPRIGASHVSMYMSLFHYWVSNDCQDPVVINRRGIMEQSKISGLATFHKCIRELHEYGYIQYSPSYHPHCNSKVYLNTNLLLTKKQKIRRKIR